MSAEETINEHQAKSDSSVISMGFSKKKEKLPLLKDMKKETINQTYQYVNYLIKGKQFQDFDNVNEIVSSKKPLPLFEENLRLIIIDSLQLENEVLNVLLSQNNHQIKRILRCKWFFQSSHSPDFYCTKIFPFVSVSLRYKIINKLSRNLQREKDADELFKFISSNYCYQQAEILLPKCSPQFILNLFTKKKQLLITGRRETIFLHITKRNPDVGLHILDTVFSSDEYDQDLYKFKNVLLHLAQHHPHIFIPFFKKYYSKMTFLTFGRKLTEKLGLKLKDWIFQSPQLSKLEIFKQDSFFRILSVEDQARYLASRVNCRNETLLLTNWTNANDRLVSLVKLLPPDRVLPVIESAFKQVYNLNYSDCSKVWTFELLELIPLNERLPYVESIEKLLLIENSEEDSENRSQLYEWLIMEANDKPERLICLKEFSIAFDEFKKLLAKTPDINRRERILQYMVRNCAINRDARGLEQLTDYIRIRFRNDSQKLISKILEEVIGSFPRAAFTRNVVEKLEELAYLGAIRFNDFYHYLLIMEECIDRRMEQNMDVKVQVKNVVNWAIIPAASAGVLSPFIPDMRSKHSRKLFHEYYREIFRWKRENPPLDKVTNRFLLEAILRILASFNRFHKKDPIQLTELTELSAEMEEVLKECHGEVCFDFKWIDLWERFSTRIMIQSYTSRFFRYVLKRNPETVVKNMEPVWKHLFENYAGFEEEKSLFLTLKKIFSFLDQTEQVKEILVKKFKTGESLTLRLNALKMYARVCNAEEFEKAIHDFLPKKGKLDLDDEGNFLKVQFAIPSLIKDVKPDWKNLTLILEFLKRDFLRNVSGSLMSYCYHTRVDVLVPTLIGLLDDIPEDGRIAYEKNIVRLVAEVSSRRENLEFCVRRWEKSHHYSVRTILLRFISKSFLEDPTPESFSILSKCILESDELIIVYKPDMRLMPKEFMNDYVSVLWKFSESQRTAFKIYFRNSILGFFERRNVGWLSEELSQNIIKSNLFKRSSVEVNDFAVHYLVSDPKKIESRMRMILELLKDSVVEERMVSTFLSSLKRICLERSSSLVIVFETFLQDWPDSVPLLFDERLSLNYCLLYGKSRKKFDEKESGDVVYGDFGKKLKAFYSSFENSNDLVLIFVESLNNFLENLEHFKTKWKEVLIAKEFLAEPSTRSFAIIAILILPPSLVKFYQEEELSNLEDFCKIDFMKVIDSLETNQDEVVQIYFRRKFGLKSLKSNSIKLSRAYSHET